MKYLIFNLFIIFSISTNAQEDIKKIIEKYAEEDVVGLNLTEEVFIHLENDLPIVTKKISKKNLYITNKKKAFAKERISFNNFKKINSVYAYTDNSLNSLKNNSNNNSLWIVKDYTDKDILRNGIFFSDNKQKTFQYPAITTNSITKLNYSVNILDPHFITPFYLQNNHPLKKATYTVTVDKNIDLAYKTFNLDSVKVTFAKEQKLTENIYTWKFQDLATTNFNTDFSPIHYIPQIAIYIKSYTTNGEKNTVLNDVKDLYLWYQSLIANINQTEQKKLEEITLSLVKNLTTEEDKIKAIYYYVQDKINYIAFEDGLNGFIPRDAMTVFEKKYGDCKDMANVLNEMLQYANIKSYLTWIGTRKKPYSYYELPTTYTDNHMITCVKKNNEYIFLDATAKYLPFNFPSPFIQGKEALVGLNKTDYNIIKVKEVSKEKNYQETISEINIDNDLSVSGKHAINLTGYKTLDFNHTLQNKKERDKTFIFKTFNIGSKKTTFLNETYKNLSLSKDTINVTFETKFKNKIKKLEQEIYLKLNIDSDLKKELVKGIRKNSAKKLDYKYTNKYTTKLNIPENIQISSIPKDTSFFNDDFGFEIKYTQTLKYIILEKNVFINTLKIPVEKINLWNKFIKTLTKSNNKSIVLKQKL